MEFIDYSIIKESHECLMLSGYDDKPINSCI